MTGAPTVLASPTRTLVVEVDLAHGARWSSLRHRGREWLWRRPEAETARALAGPDDVFVDAGGLEECSPTVRGRPDHGDVWWRGWVGTARSHRVDADRFGLERTVTVEDDRLSAAYRMSASPGFPFLWAGHLLLDLSPHARLRAADGTAVRYFHEGESWERRCWPDEAGTGLDRIGADDGTAVSAIVECAAIEVSDGPDRLHVAVHADGQPGSIGLWRNRRGWPASAPYRSIGVEPMIGRVWDRDAAEPGDAGTVGPDGMTSWTMVLSWDGENRGFDS